MTFVPGCIENLAASSLALAAIWTVGLLAFTFWWIFEFRGMIFTSLIPWKPMILRSFRAGFVFFLLLPVVLLAVSAMLGPWGILVLILGTWYLPPSVYVLCISLGILYSVLRPQRVFSPSEKRAAYSAFAVSAAIGMTMLYVSLVWLDKPV